MEDTNALHARPMTDADDTLTDLRPRCWTCGAPDAIRFHEPWWTIACAEHAPWLDDAPGARDE